MASNSVVVRGRFTGGAFIPDGPLPEVEGAAELVITLPAPAGTHSMAEAFGTGRALLTAEEIGERSHSKIPEQLSIWDVIGKVLPERTTQDIAEQLHEDREERWSIAEAFGTGFPLRTAEDIEEQMHEERDSWGDR